MKYSSTPQTGLVVTPSPSTPVPPMPPTYNAGTRPVTPGNNTGARSVTPGVNTANRSVFSQHPHARPPQHSHASNSLPAGHGHAQSFYNQQSYPNQSVHGAHNSYPTQPPYPNGPRPTHTSHPSYTGTPYSAYSSHPAQPPFQNNAPATAPPPHPQYTNPGHYQHSLQPSYSQPLPPHTSQPPYPSGSSHSPHPSMSSPPPQSPQSPYTGGYASGPQTPQTPYTPNHAQKPSQASFAGAQSPQSPMSNAPTVNSGGNNANANANTTGASGYTPTGYTPVGFHGPAGAPSPAEFYGSLIDENCEPSEILCRMSDALFFHVDQRCEIPSLRGSGRIEPDKYAWLMLKTGQSEENTQLGIMALKLYYDCANIPYQVVQTRTGEQIPVVDRRGWLHLHVFDARADPNEAHKDWTNALQVFGLIDPLTKQPFPTPIPHSAFPAFADITLKRKLEDFQVKAVAEIIRLRMERQQAETNAVLASFNASIQNSMSYMNRPNYGNMFNTGMQNTAAGIGTGAATSLLGGGGGGGSDGGGDGGHANMTDAATAAMNLANNLVTAANGNDGNGALGGLASLLMGGGLLGGVFS